MYACNTYLKICPIGKWNTYYSNIDALFGLCRKKAAGSSVRSPLSGDRMFEPQHRVNAFVENYKYTKDCSPKVQDFCLKCT